MSVYHQLREAVASIHIPKEIAHKGAEIAERLNHADRQAEHASNFHVDMQFHKKKFYTDHKGVKMKTSAKLAEAKKDSEAKTAAYHKVRKEAEDHEKKHGHSVVHAWEAVHKRHWPHYKVNSHPGAPLTHHTDASFEEIAAGNNIPNEFNATKSSNHLIKHYKARRSKNYSPNPYSNEQHHDHTISHTNGKRLEKDLHEQGWEKSHSMYHREGVHTYKHPNGGHMVVHHDETNTSVTTHGSKKAKRSTLPHYD